MDRNKSLANTHSIIGNSIYMKSGNNSNEYVSVIKPLKIVGFSEQVLPKTPEGYYFDTKKLKKQLQKRVVELSELYERYLLTEGH